MGMVSPLSFRRVVTPTSRNMPNVDSGLRGFGAVVVFSLESGSLHTPVDGSHTGSLDILVTGEAWQIGFRWWFWMAVGMYLLLNELMSIPKMELFWLEEMHLTFNKVSQSDTN